MKVLFADIETNGFLRELDTLWCIALKAPGKKARAYSDHSSRYRPISEAIEKLQSADRIVFHNGAGFDLPALHKLGHTVDPSKLYDTVVASRLYHPERRQGHSLRAWGEALGFEKFEFDEFEKFSHEMVTYCVRDVEVTERIYETLEPKLRSWGESVDLEHKVAWIVEKQVRSGFYFDVKAAQELAADLTQEHYDILQEIRETFHPIWVPDKEFTPKRDNRRAGYVAGCTVTKVKLQEFNPGSRQQIAERLKRRYGWKPREFTPSGQAKVDETILADLPYAEANVLARYLRVGKQLGMIAGDNGWLTKVHADSRIRGSVNTNGCVTGRMSHFDPNVAQADKKDPRMRACWIAAPGRKLVGIDADAIELRKLAHFLARYDKGRLARIVDEGSKEDGTDIHTMNQKAVGLFHRDTPGAKEFVYAMIYGAQNPRLGSIVQKDARAAGKVIRGRDAAIGKQRRDRIEASIVGLPKLIKKVKASAKERGYIIGLDGRKVRVRSQHSALNTLLQSGGGVAMKKALVLFEEDMQGGTVWGYDTGPDYAYCANVHDEVQIECEPSIAEEIAARFIGAIERAGRELGVRCPLRGEAKIGQNWAETH